MTTAPVSSNASGADSKGLTPEEAREVLDWVSACQSSYHMDSTPGHRLGGADSQLQENRDALIDFVDSLVRGRMGLACRVASGNPSSLTEAEVEALIEPPEVVGESGLYAYYTREQVIDHMQAATDLVFSKVVPAGFKVVPIEPTESMRQAGAQFAECGISANAVFGYRAMLEAASVAPTPVERGDEPDAAKEWRRLALQFDAHRMQAIAHLRAMLSNSMLHAPLVVEFLKAGPLSGEVVLAQRLAALAFPRGVPAGFKLVPIEPSKDMIDAGCAHTTRDDDEEPYRARGAAIAAYKDMLDAAPALVAPTEVRLIDWQDAHDTAWQAAAAFQPPYFGNNFQAHGWIVEAIRSAHMDGQLFAAGLPKINRALGGEPPQALRKQRAATAPVTPALTDAQMINALRYAMDNANASGSIRSQLVGHFCNKIKEMQIDALVS